MGKVFYTERDIEDMVQRGERSLTINDDVVRYYRRHWTLGEIVHFGSRILFFNTDDGQSEKDTDELLEVLGWIGVP